jgi:uncharacterized protein HemX
MATKKPASKLAEGLGLAALAAGAAAAAAGYYFYGTQGKAHRKTAAAWTKKAKTEMIKKIKEMKSVSKQNYDKAASEVMAKYKQAKNIDPKELQELGQELKSHWEKISKQVSQLGIKKVVPSRKKASK